MTIPHLADSPGLTDSTPENQKDAFKWLLGFVAPQRNRVLALLGLSLITSGLVLAQPYLTKQVIDVGLLGKDFDALLFYSLALLGLGLASTVLSGVSRYWHTSLSGKILFALRESVYAHLQRLSPAFYARNRTGDILSRLDGDVAELQRFALDGMFAAISGTLGLVGSVALLFWLNAKLALVALVMLPLEWAYLRYMRPKVEQRTRHVRERSADISSFLVETLPAMKFIQTVSAEDREKSRLFGLNRHYLKDLLNLQLTEFATQAVPTVLTTASRTFVFLLGGYWVIQGEMALGSLIAFSAYLGMAVGPVHTLLGLYVALRRVKVSIVRVRELTESKPDLEEQNDSAVVPTELRGEISFENISFSYPEAEHPVFQNAQTQLPAGSKIGIYGPSGIGKTTLVDLLLRHYDPDSGSIKVDGRDLRDYDLAAWRRQVAVVAQDIVLFHGTLADNIRYANPAANDAAVAGALEQAQLQDLVEQLPEGLNTVIGERGTRLSGGQRQRVALARTLLQDPAILILDEATSAVDQEQESRLMAVIDDLFANHTRLVISHRDSPISDADWLLTIVDGQLQISNG